jgi:hypothetical protein
MRGRLRLPNEGTGHASFPVDPRPAKANFGFWIRIIADS